jgi:hypothetical protein
MAPHEVTGAGGHFIRAVELARKAHDRHVEAWTLDYLGTAAMSQSTPEVAGPPGAAGLRVTDGGDRPAHQVG